MCAEMRKTVIVVIFIVLFIPHTVLIFQHTMLIQGRKGLFTLISDIYADLLGISMLEKSNMVDGINIRVIDC